jgi:hypothetical protein
MDITGLGGTGGLRGADPDLGPFAAIGRGMGLSVTSGIRPGDTTISGNKSYHSSGDAIDMGGPMGGMRRFAGTMFSRFGGRLRELISPWSELGIKDGRPYRYSGAIQAQHSGGNAHVHVAYTGPFGDGIGQAASAARAAGFRGRDLVTAVAIAGPESSYRNSARLVTGQEDSRGMWQINTLAHPWARSMDLTNPNVAARAAHRVWRQAGGFGPWTAFSSGSYRSFMDRARAAVSGGGSPSSGGVTPRTTPGGTRWAGSGGGGNVPSSLPGGGSQTNMALGMARVNVERAQAQHGDNLGAYIKTLKDEREIHRRRLKAVNKALRRKRLGPKARTALLEEKAELIGTIGDLTDNIKEYKADAAGGATTITQAEALEAGVAPDTGGGDGGTPAPDPNIARLVELKEEERLRDLRIEKLLETQGPQILAAFTAMFNSSIGGSLGLGGMQAAGIPGQLARY